MQRRLKFAGVNDRIVTRWREVARRQAVVECRARPNHDVGGIERPGAGRAPVRRSIDADAADVQQLAGGFDVAAIAALFAATRCQHARDGSGRNRWRADLDISAISFRRSGDRVQRAGNIDVPALNVDGAARSIGVLRLQRAGDLRRTVRAQPDMAADGRRAGGAHQPAIIARQRIGVTIGRDNTVHLPE